MTAAAAETEKVLKLYSQGDITADRIDKVKELMDLQPDAGNQGEDSNAQVTVRYREEESC